MVYLAIDGGGSGCRAVLCDAEGRALDRAEGGPANIATDFEAALDSLRGLALRVIADRPLDQVRAVLGVAGANLSGAAPRLGIREGRPRSPHSIRQGRVCVQRVTAFPESQRIAVG